MKKFWKRTEGFTLVELIVVIAILGILAGVGTVGYSGYVKKANMAADQQLLAQLNTAYSVACIENGMDAIATEASNIVIGDDKEVSEDDIIVTTPAAKNADIRAAFGRFFEGGTFKVAKSLTFIDGVFVDPENTDALMYAELPNGGRLYITAEQLALLQNSTYKEHVDDLMVQVDEISGMVIGLLDFANDTNGFARAALSDFMGSEAYLTNAIIAMGGTVAPGSDLSTLQTQYTSIVGEFKKNQVIEKVAEQFGVEPEEVDIIGNSAHGEAYNNLRAGVSQMVDQNILVLGVAQSAATQSKEGALAIIKGDNPKEALKKAMLGQGGSSTASGMGNAALVYGMFTAFAKSDAGTDEARSALTSTDPTKVFDLLGDDPTTLAAFQAYVDTDQGKADMDACIAAMEVIDNTATNPDSVNGVLASGFTDTAFVNALKELLNRNA